MNCYEIIHIMCINNWNLYILLRIEGIELHLLNYKFQLLFILIITLIENAFFVADYETAGSGPVNS